VRGAAPQGAAGGLHNVRSRVKVGLADLQVHNVASGGLKGFRPCEHLERGLGAETAHPSSKAYHVHPPVW